MLFNTKEIKVVARDKKTIPTTAKTKEKNFCKKIAEENLKQNNIKQTPKTKRSKTKHANIHENKQTNDTASY